MASPLRHLRARALKAFFFLHREIYERSDGRFGASLRTTGPGGESISLPMLLLSTKGRKSGLWRTTPLAFFVDGDSLVVVGSDGGARRDPQWWKNLEVDPIARLRVGRRVFSARARLATGAERERLWEVGRGVNPAWERYQKHCDRTLPVVVFDPLPGAPAG